MTTQRSNQNPFAEGDIPSLEALLINIETDYQIPHQRRHDICSAIRKLESLFNRPLSMIPASADFLRRLFEGTNHHTLGISKSRLGNIRSHIMSAFRHAGISTSLAPYGAKLAPDWRALTDANPEKYQRNAISRFARYCSSLGLSISDVSDEIIESYLAALIAETLVKKPYLNVQTLCRVWNQIADDNLARLMPRLKVPHKESRSYAAHDDALSPRLLDEINNYLHFLSTDQLIGGLRKPLRPRSIETIKGNIRRYLGALHRSGIDISTIYSLEQLVDFELFKAAMAWLWERFDQKPCQGIGGTAWTIRCIAVKHLKCDEMIAKQFDKVLTKVSTRRQGLSDKNRAAMQQFDDVAVVRKFLCAGDVLWEMAEKQGRNKKGSLLAQSSVLLDILIHAPMRITNLQNLHIDRHIGWSQHRLRISIPPAEVKNSEQLDYLLPEGISARIYDYMKNWRPLFFPASNPYLFPGRNGLPKEITALRRQITNSLFKQTGIRLSPHQFRHVAAKILLDQKPGHYEVGRKILGHKSISTIYNHYAGTEIQSAHDLYDTTILSIKEDRPAVAAMQRTNMAEQAFLDPLNPFGNGTRR